tara:strand:- start:757 stop:1146 length:390 start_codon:yes stop_codon:yes gene_type:complete
MENDMINRFCITAMVITAITLFSSFTSIPQGKGQPVVPKLSQFRGDIFKNFAEFRVQNSKFDVNGILTMQDAPFKMLVNCTTVIKVHRFEDSKEKDYSCLMFIREQEPILVRETYDDVLRKMKRAIESR